MNIIYPLQKKSNIFLDANMTVKVPDFGLSLMGYNQNVILD